MNALHFCFGLGAFLSPLVIDRVVALGGGIRWAYWLLAALAVPVAAWVARLPSPSPQDEARTDQPSGQGYGWLTALVAGLMFLNVAVELTFGGWIFSYAVALRPGAATAARLLNSTYWGALALGRLISIPLATRLHPRTMLLLDILGALASVGVAVLLPGWPPAVWIASFGLGLSIASLFPSVLNYAGSAMPITGRTTGFILVGAGAGSMVMPWLVGQLFEGIGPHMLMVTLSANLIATLLLFAVTTWYVRGLSARRGMEAA
jgi:FHS family Na+ dependent glucose MFS transporter 1